MAVINPSNCRKLEEQIQYGCTILMFKIGERTIIREFFLFFFFLKFMEHDAHLILEFISLTRFERGDLRRAGTIF